MLGLHQEGGGCTNLPITGEASLLLAAIQHVLGRTSSVGTADMTHGPGFAKSQVCCWVLLSKLMLKGTPGGQTQRAAHCWKGIALVCSEYCWTAA